MTLPIVSQLSSMSIVPLGILDKNDRDDYRQGTTFRPSRARSVGIYPTVSDLLR
jgi:hypothetical protein